MRCACTFGARSLHPGLEKATVSLFRPRRMEKSRRTAMTIHSWTRNRSGAKSRNFQLKDMNFYGYFRCCSDGIEIAHALSLYYYYYFFRFSSGFIGFHSRSKRFLCPFQKTRIQFESNQPTPITSVPFAVQTCFLYVSLGVRATHACRVCTWSCISVARHADYTTVPFTQIL